mmetsp:Transcript_6917/g.13835  ORF Transcript_6917/g.13835 Transcript_6917/m.13835 type:complete len:223 (+) Transcript_6917:334-1002(+)
MFRGLGANHHSSRISTPLSKNQMGPSPQNHRMDDRRRCHARCSPRRIQRTLPHLFMAAHRAHFRRRCRRHDHFLRNRSHLVVRRIHDPSSRHHCLLLDHPRHLWTVHVHPLPPNDQIERHQSRRHSTDSGLLLRYILRICDATAHQTRRIHHGQRRDERGTSQSRPRLVREVPLGCQLQGRRSSPDVICHSSHWRLSGREFPPGPRRHCLTRIAVEFRFEIR